MGWDGLMSQQGVGRQDNETIMNILNYIIQSDTLLLLLVTAIL